MHTGHMATVGLSIESSNVVGYQNKAVRQYLSQQVCTFDQIGVEGGALDLQNLIPVDENGDAVGEGDVTIQFISDRGALVADYAYYLADEMDEAAGWYDGDGNYAELTLSAGEAFQISAIQAVHFVYSGEVNLAETDVPFRRYLSVQANIRPANVDIQSILPVDSEDEVIGGGDVTIQFISNRGALVADYAYYLSCGRNGRSRWMVRWRRQLCGLHFCSRRRVQALRHESGLSPLPGNVKRFCVAHSVRRNN